MTNTKAEFIKSLNSLRKKTVRHYKYFVCYHSEEQNGFVHIGKRINDLCIRKAMTRKNAEKNYIQGAKDSNWKIINSFRVIAEFDTEIDAALFIKNKIREYRENEKHTVRP